MNEFDTWMKIFPDEIAAPKGAKCNSRGQRPGVKQFKSNQR
jgi:hypothetical protein